MSVFRNRGSPIQLTKNISIPEGIICLNRKRGIDDLRLVTVKLPEALIDGLDNLVQSGLYPSRSAAIRTAVRDMLKRELWRTDV